MVVARTDKNGDFKDPERRRRNCTRRAEKQGNGGKPNRKNKLNVLSNFVKHLGNTVIMMS